MDERRQLPRWEIKKEARVWLPGVMEFNYGFIEDMHLKGMRIFFNRPLPEQKVLRMSFTIGGDTRRIKIEAAVEWSKQDQGCFVYGLSFCKIDEFEKERIYQYINNNCYDQFREKWWGKQN